jgi:hypothetical protein
LPKHFWRIGAVGSSLHELEFLPRGPAALRSVPIRQLTIARIGLFALLVIFEYCVLGGTSAHAQDKNWKKDLEAALLKEFPPRVYRGGAIQEKGLTVAIRQAGAVGGCQAALFLPQTKVKHGVIINPATSVKRGESPMPVGTTAFIHDIKVENDDVRFRLQTVEMFTADGLQWSDFDSLGKRDKVQACQLAVHFQFDRGFLETASVETVKNEIVPVIASVDQIVSADQKIIEMGQTLAQVEQILGKPSAVAKLGAKTIYTYKDMKIVFTDGKVSDVQ